jgi:glycosyltransferase involved in cell wall biosynthesis
MKKEKSKMIYIAHGYGDRNHFVALYQKAYEFGYEVSEQIILSNKAFLGRILRCLLKRNLIEALGYIKVKFEFLFLKDQILIVSLPAYDYTLLKYKRILEKNCCFFHSSHPFWDGSYYTKGNLRIRSKFEDILRYCFMGGFCVNDMAAEGLREFIPDCRLVYHSINTDKYRKREPMQFSKDGKRYLYLGQFREIKNARVILEWAKCNPNTDVKFTFIGKGELETEILKAAKIDNRIILEGYHDKSKIQEELHNYDYLILPSHFETLGIVLLEAMAAGVPCIVSNVSGPLSVIQEDYTGFFFDVKEGIHSFDKAMKKSLDISRDKYLAMSQNAIAEAKKYDVDTISKVWFSLIEEKVEEYNKNDGHSNSICR